MGDYRSRLYEAAEDAIGAGSTADEVRETVEDAISSMMADRSFMREEYGQELYPQLVAEEKRRG